MDQFEELIDARLVTSYEVEGREGEANHHRVEVVHESLLKAWPRLVWWQTQDEEGAVLRDQLKQAAHLWDEKGRTDDLLWTGTAYQEFAPWRDRAVIGDIGGEVCIWDVPSARVVRRLKSPADARSIALDPKERFLATGPPGAASLRSVFLFDLAAHGRAGAATREVVVDEHEVQPGWVVARHCE